MLCVDENLPPSFKKTEAASCRTEQVFVRYEEYPKTLSKVDKEVDYVCTR